jgi:SAM-dependent methyltransferase
MGLRNYLLRFNYPQIAFAGTIRRYLQSLENYPNLIVDCPCGNGETAFHLSRTGPVKVYAADLSTEAIESAKQHFSNEKISFICESIQKTLTSIHTECVFCIINSLFLLPDAEGILRDLKTQMPLKITKLLLIIPNTEGKNFKWFQQHNNAENKLVIPAANIHSFFQSRGFKVERIEPIVYVRHFNRKELRFLSIFWSSYLNILNSAQSFLKIGKPNYFFIALSV